MKKMKLLLIGAAFSAVAFTSCSDDDNNGGINNQVQIAGTYRLTEVNTEEATDFNEDNTSNVNQMMESNCFIDSQVTFNADNTFIYNIKNILVDEAAGTSACNSYTVGGIWILQGGVGTSALIDATYEAPNGQAITIRFNKEGDQLTQFTQNGQYADIDENGGAVYTSGSVELIFERQ